MPTSYTIDESNRIVHSIAHGAVTDEEILRHTARLTADSHFRAEFNHLIDTTRITEVQVTSQCIRMAAGLSAFSPGSHRAFVTAKPVIIGLVRMFELSQRRVGEVRIFTTVDEAHRWLTGGRPVPSSLPAPQPVT